MKSYFGGNDMFGLRFVYINGKEQHHLVKFHLTCKLEPVYNELTC